MNRSNASTLVGGGEMKRETSSVVSSANNDAASELRSSRRTTCPPVNVGRPARQSELTIGAGAVTAANTAASVSTWYGIVSIRSPPRPVEPEAAATTDQAVQPGAASTDRK